jgi:hypothetical protein
MKYEKGGGKEQTEPGLQVTGCAGGQGADGI